MGAARSTRRLSLLPGLLAGAVTVGTVMTLASACGSSDTAANEPPPLATSMLGEDASPPPDAGPADTAPVDAGPEARRWIGTLATSKTVEFGGSPYCKYKVTLKNIVVDVTLKKTGEVVSGSVRNQMIEEVVAPCSFRPQPPSLHEYVLASAKQGDGGLHLDFAPAAFNRPVASLFVEGPLDAPGATANVKVEWHRTDQKAPLDWRVTATVPVSVK